VEVAWIGMFVLGLSAMDLIILAINVKLYSEILKIRELTRGTQTIPQHTGIRLPGTGD